MHTRRKERKGGDTAYGALNYRALFAKEPTFVGLFSIYMHTRRKERYAHCCPPAYFV